MKTTVEVRASLKGDQAQTDAENTVAGVITTFLFTDDSLKTKSSRRQGLRALSVSCVGISQRCCPASQRICSKCIVKSE